MLDKQKHTQNIEIRLVRDPSDFESAKQISKTSADYHHHDLKSKEIREELIEYAQSKWELGITTILVGHYHQTGIIEKEGYKIIFIGDWLRHYTVTRLDKKGWWQGNWRNI